MILVGWESLESQRLKLTREQQKNQQKVFTAPRKHMWERKKKKQQKKRKRTKKKLSWRKRLELASAPKLRIKRRRRENGKRGVNARKVDGARLRAAEVANSHRLTIHQPKR